MSEEGSLTCAGGTLNKETDKQIEEEFWINLARFHVIVLFLKNSRDSLTVPVSSKTNKNIPTMGAHLKVQF